MMITFNWRIRLVAFNVEHRPIIQTSGRHISKTLTELQQVQH
jgi:hypothetical protein